MVDQHHLQKLYFRYLVEIGPFHINGSLRNPNMSDYSNIVVGTDLSSSEVYVNYLGLLTLSLGLIMYWSSRWMGSMLVLML